MSFAEVTQYGFNWNGCTVVRMCSSDKGQKFTLLQIITMNGETIEILMRPRSTKIMKKKK